jgi:hypothetical protein
MNIGIFAHSMPRRLARVSHREIAHVIRAAKEAIQAEVVIGNEEQIRIVLSPDAPAVFAKGRRLSRLDNVRSWK